MARILALAPSGFGKTTGIGEVVELGLTGLDPKSTYVISATSKPLPFKESAVKYKVTTADKLQEGRRVITNNAATVAKILLDLLKTPIKTVVLDDFNYIMQDWYMDNALKTGWDAPKKIGYDIGQIFKAIEKYEGTAKNVILLAHSEDVVKSDGRIYAKLKTTGKMTDEYITPEGKFDVVLVGKSHWDGNAKKVVKQYITNENEDYSSPKSPYGMFSELMIPNDLGLVVNTINKFYNGE